MKHSQNLLLAALAMIASIASPALAEDQPPLVEVESHFIHATDAQMQVALEAAGFTSASMILTMGPEETAKVFKALKKQGADFFDSPRAVTRAGVEATVESVQEFRYPTEYREVKETPGKSMPTSFETRNVGVTLIFKAAVLEDSQIDLTLDATAVSFRGFIDYSNAKPGAKADEDPISRLLKAPLREGGVWQPVFTHQTMKTQVTVPSGRQIWLGGMGDAAKNSTPGVRTFLFIAAHVAEVPKAL